MSWYVRLFAWVFLLRYPITCDFARCAWFGGAITKRQLYNFTLTGWLRDSWVVTR